MQNSSPSLWPRYGRWLGSLAGLGMLSWVLLTASAESDQPPPPLFSSPVITAKTPGQAVDIDVEVSGRTMLYLVVTDAGDGITCDLANWIDPRWVSGEREQPLSEQDWAEARSSWGKTQRNRNAEGGPLRVNGKEVKGIGTHANSLIAFQVPEGVQRFRVRAGLDSQGVAEGEGATVQFLVYAERPQLEIERLGGESAEPEQNGDAVQKFKVDEFFGSSGDTSNRATLPESLRLPVDFQAELVYTVPRAKQGSWVCLTSERAGRLVASAQWGGLYRITPAPLDDPDTSTRVEPIEVPIGHAQGLLYAFGSLYVVVNGEDAGLYRVRDTDGDDQYDTVTCLREFRGGGEHGPHAVVLGPDQQSLYVIGGNASYLKEAPEASRVPTGWQQDRLIGRTEDAEGGVDLLRPAGWICRTDPEGKQFTLVAMGFRNPYDLAFNTAGELFTFDSDMEWDIGTPWYRPTRVNHVLSGADFGWRAGMSKWPADYLDSFGSVVDIGLSSPTGVTFGNGTRYPQRYQRALYLADWSLGNIFAVHLDAQGASYTGTFEPFVSGAPLPVTDLVVHPDDGCLYFTVGGRGTTSALYRVRYVGDDSVAPAPPQLQKEAAPARALRKTLEALHRPVDPAALDQVWPHLGHTDRAIRHAARIALEHQPVAGWQTRALEEPNPRCRIAALTALARQGEALVRPKLLDALLALPWQQLDTDDRADWLRATMLALSRLGRLSEAKRSSLTQALLAVYPTDRPRLDRDLAELLAYLGTPEAIAPTLKLLATADTQEEQIHYAFCLTEREHGWTLEQRKQLFGWLQESARQRGGVSFEGFLRQLRERALEPLTEVERDALGELLEIPPPSDPYAKAKERPFVRDWKVKDLHRFVNQSASEADLAAGRKVFQAAACYRCHRVAGQGGITGPDLTGVRGRFNIKDLLEATLEPSRVISDQYRAVQIATFDGRLLTGKITDINGNTLLLMNDPLNPADLTMVARDKIEELTWSKVSMMPKGLLNHFTREEIRDLVAFLRSEQVSSVGKGR